MESPAKILYQAIHIARGIYMRKLKEDMPDNNRFNRPEFPPFEDLLRWYEENRHTSTTCRRYYMWDDAERINTRSYSPMVIDLPDHDYFVGREMSDLEKTVHRMYCKAAEREGVGPTGQLSNRETEKAWVRWRRESAGNGALTGK